MPSAIIPETFGILLASFSGCFQAQSYRTFQWLVTGWIQCLRRRTITGVVLASGAVGERHISVFHRFFARAQWSLDAVGRVVFELALRWRCAGSRRTSRSICSATTRWPARAGSV
jgi:hypothetical protein